MQRREFIRRTSTLVAGMITASAFGETSSLLPEAGGRLVLPMNRNWRFSRTAKPEARMKDFDDSAFDRVVVPHTTTRLPWHSFDDKEYEFVSVYRRHFKVPAGARGRRVFVDFEGVMTASTVWLNGTKLGEYKGGFTPFSFELTQHVDWVGENVLAVEVDSTERADIPPFGYEIDYLTFGGIYREVQLRLVSPTFIENIFAQPKDVLSASPSLDVHCFMQFDEVTGGEDSQSVLEAALYDGQRLVAKATQELPVGGRGIVNQTLHLENLGAIELWGLKTPKLYRVEVRLLHGNHVLDSEERRIGFREAKFTPQGFSLNGTVVKLRGLDRHQTFPWVGQAMPGRVQRQDAVILRKNLKCNIVRTSHYPQSRHFLDACDEIGLLVLEEIPGWQHIGGESWKEISVDNARRMIRRD